MITAKRASALSYIRYVDFITPPIDERGVTLLRQASVKNTAGKKAALPRRRGMASARTPRRHAAFFAATMPP